MHATLQEYVRILWRLTNTKDMSLMRTYVWTCDGAVKLYILAYRDYIFTGEYLGDQSNFDPSSIVIKDQIFIPNGQTSPFIFSSHDQMFSHFETIYEEVNEWAKSINYDETDDSHLMAFKLRWM